MAVPKAVSAAEKRGSCGLVLSGVADETGPTAVAVEIGLNGAEGAAGGAGAGDEEEVLSHRLRKSLAYDPTLENAVRAAANHAKGFSFAKDRSEWVQEGTALIRGPDGRVTDASFLKGIQSFKAKRAAGRLSLERLDATVALAGGQISPLDLDNLREFAIDGVTLVTPLARGAPTSGPRPFFSAPADPRKRSVFEKGLEGTVERGDAFVVWEKDLLALSPERLNFIAAHWVPKEGKVAGRVIGDASRRPYPLNDPDDREAIRTKLGKKIDPTFDTVALLIHAQRCEYGPENVSLWKSDMANAFNLLYVANEQVGLQCISVSGGVAVVQPTMTFGNNCSGNGFGPCTRLVRKAVEVSCGELVDAHTDDVFGCSLTEKAPQTAAATERIVAGLLGPDAVNREKTAWGPILDIIGWEWDVREGVRVKEKNYLKMVEAFALAVPGKAMPVRFWMKLSSLVSRYQRVVVQLRWLRPALTQIHAMREGCTWNSLDALITPPESGQQAIRMAKLVFEAHETPGGRYTLPWSLAVILPSTWLIESDASLEGFGIRIYEVQVSPDFNPAEWCRQEWNREYHREENLEGELESDIRRCHELDQQYDFGLVRERAVLRFASAGKWPFNWDKLLGEGPTKLRKSSLQNTCEFMGHLLGKILLAREGKRDVAVTPIMDSKSGLKWARTTSSKSQFCRWPLLFDTALVMECRIIGRAGVYINTHDMEICDAFSRAADPRTALADAGISEELWRFPTEEELELIDPTRVWRLDDDEELTAQWAKMRQHFRG